MFRLDICTSREQSERLLALGLKKETADCHYEGRKNKECEWEVAVMGGCYYSRDFPAWSLGRLVEIVKNCSFENFESEIWRRELKAFCINLLVRHSDDLFENAIQVIEMLICRGYFNNEYLIQKRKS